MMPLAVTAEWHYVYPSTPHLRIPEAPRPADEWWVPDINNVIEAAWLADDELLTLSYDRQLHSYVMPSDEA